MTPTDLPLLSTADWLLVVGGLLASVVMITLVVRGFRRWRAARLDVAEPPPLLIPVERRGSGPSPLAGIRFGQNGALPGEPVANAPSPIAGPAGHYAPTAQNGSNGLPLTAPIASPVAAEVRGPGTAAAPTPTFTND